jgi:hypothetical protein
MISIKAVLKKIFSKDLVLISIILLVSLYPRLWNLETVPPMIVDEPASLRDISVLWNKLPSFYPAEFNWGFSEATLVYYPTIILSKILGRIPDLYLFRLTSVIFSMLGIIPFYYLFKQQVNRFLAFAATLLFSFSYYYLQFSRVGWQIVYMVSMGLYLLWFLQIAVGNFQIRWFVLAGVVAGLMIYGYRSGEVYIGAGIIYLVVSLIKTKINIKTKLKYFFFFLGSLLIIASPWLGKISQNWELYNLRQRVVSVFNTTPYHGMTQTNEIIKYQIITTFRSWILLEPVNGGGIENPRYLPLKNSPVNMIIRLLFIIGLFLSLKQLKKTYVWWFVLIFGIIFGQILTVDPPNGARGLILLPIIYFFSAITLEKIYAVCHKNIIVLSLIVVISLLISYYDFLYYQYWMSWF